MLYLFFSIVVLIAAVLLILIVLVQNSKGGGLSSSFASTNQVMGVRKTTEAVEKVTWILAGVLLGVSILASGSIPKAASEKSEIENTVQGVNPSELIPGTESTGFEAPAAEQPVGESEAAQ